MDAQLRASLAIIRSLGKKDIKITAGSEKEGAMGFFSKYCLKRIVYPNPRTKPELFIKLMLKNVINNNYEAIIPSHTYTTYLLCKYREFFSDYTHIPPPNFEIFCNAYDKKKLLKIAIKNGIDCPKTYFFNDVNEIISNIQRYPVVVKSSKRHGVGIEICKTVDDLKQKYAKMSKKYGDCIVQEYIPNGGELGVYTLFNFGSEPIALTVQKRLRSLNYYGGVSTLRETTKNDEIVKIAFDLLKTIKWSGVAMVEFRIDSRDKIPKLMEINPRFWGSLQLSILSGIDFPYLLYKLILDEKLLPKLYFQEGIRCRWLNGDITSFIKGPNRLNFIINMMKPNINDDVLSIKDLKPFIASIIYPHKDSCDEEPRNEELIINKNDLIS